MTPEELARQLVETIAKWDMAKPAPRFGTLIRQAMTLAAGRGEEAEEKFMRNFTAYVSQTGDEIAEWAYTAKEPLPRIQARALDYIRKYFSP